MDAERIKKVARDVVNSLPGDMTLKEARRALAAAYVFLALEWACSLEDFELDYEAKEDMLKKYIEWADAEMDKIYISARLDLVMMSHECGYK